MWPLAPEPNTNGDRMIQYIVSGLGNLVGSLRDSGAVWFLRVAGQSLTFVIPSKPPLRSEGSGRADSCWRTKGAHPYSNCTTTTTWNQWTVASCLAYAGYRPSPTRMLGDFIRRLVSLPLAVKLLAAALGILVIHATFRLLEKRLPRHFSPGDARYRVRKFVVFLGYVIAILFMAILFGDRLGRLSFTLGIAGAGVAVALQE